MSTIRFDHTKNSHSEALDMDDEQMEALSNTLAGISLHIVKDKPRKSEITEMLVQTLSYKELAMLATEAIEYTTQKALKSYEKFMREDDSEDDDDDYHDIQSIKIDAEDIDGSLAKYDIPEDVKRQLKERILEELKDKLKDED